MTPRISIITPSYNQGQFLEKTILSVLSQDYPNLEYIIIDGGSVDSSVDIIKKYENQLSYWVSEKDKGQTHAINKGLRRATGELVNWLNSDDLLEPNALNIFSRAVLEHPDSDAYFGDYRAINASGDTIYARKSAPYSRNALFWGRQLSSQPSVFFKRSLLDRVGYLDETKHFCMDTEFWIRCTESGAKFTLIPESLGVTRVHCDTKTANLQNVLRNEHKIIVRGYNSLKRFKPNSMPEDICFTGMNHFWRLSAAMRRMVFRQDFSFFQASKALETIKQEMK